MAEENKASDYKNNTEHKYTVWVKCSAISIKPNGTYTN